MGTINGGIFYCNVINYGQITGSVFYGGITLERYGGNIGTIDSNATKYTVKFDLNGGSYDIEPVEQVFVGINTATDMKPQTDPTGPTGYAFDAWYYNDEKYDFTKPVTEDITLVAKYTFANYDIHLHCM